MSNKKTWFITGAGRGMGLDFAEAALEARHAVVATARDPHAVAKAIGKSDDLLTVTCGRPNVPLSSLAQQRRQFREDIFDDGQRKLAGERGVACRPIQAFRLVAENGAADRQAIGKNYFERVAFDLAGDRTEERQTRTLIVRSQRKRHGWPVPGLFTTGLRVEMQPD